MVKCENGKRAKRSRLGWETAYYTYDTTLHSSSNCYELFFFTQIILQEGTSVRFSEYGGSDTNGYIPYQALTFRYLDI